MLVLLFLVVEKFVSVVDPDGYSTSPPCSGKSISCTSSLFFLFETNAARIITPVN